MRNKNNITIEDVESYWNENPLCASAIPYALGTPEYFEYYNKLREANEPIKFSYKLHEYKNFKGKMVLDVGAGNGYILSHYAREGAKVYGVDVTETGTKLCRGRFKLMALKGDFRKANAEELPFDNEMFYCVCSMGVLHHTPNSEKAIDEIYRVLKKGGRLIAMFYHRNSAKYRVLFPLLLFLNGKSIEQSVNEVDGIGNPKGEAYSKSELKKLLRKFDDLEMFAGLLRNNMILPKYEKLIPNSFLKPFEKYFGWFLYAKGFKT